MTLIQIPCEEGNRESNFQRLNYSQLASDMRIMNEKDQVFQDQQVSSLVKLQKNIEPMSLGRELKRVRRNTTIHSLLQIHLEE